MQAFDLFEMFAQLFPAFGLRRILGLQHDAPPDGVYSG
jgi:hypothetical protein